MTEVEKTILLNIHKRGNIHKVHNKWCIPAVKIELAIKDAIFPNDDRWLIALSTEEFDKIHKIMNGMINRGIIRYSRQPSGEANRFNMILENKYWELYNSVK